MQQSPDLEGFKAKAATFAYLDKLQGVTGEVMHGPDSNGVHLKAGEWVPFVTTTTYGENPWDFVVHVDCSEVWSRGREEHEDISSLYDYYLFQDAGDLFITHYAGEFLDFENAWDIALLDEEKAELIRWFPVVYCGLKRKRFPFTKQGKKAPAWLIGDMLAYADRHAMILK